MTLEELKAAARKAAFERRRMAHAGAYAVSGYLSEVLAGYRGVPLAGYMPMRTEINPLPAMAEAAAHGPVGVPVIMGAGQALRFSLWEPDGDMKDGPFGAQIPVVEAWMEPEILIVPLVAFDRQGGRLGYGGGFYDRTLECLRAKGPVLAIGFAYAAQETEALPLEPTDQPLDMIVTESGVLPLSGR
ncbi:5-formyltetrahydrofolate cyclo-ligase [Sulfitobacter sp. BDSS02]|nr:5-formyltetrahydrofolate cyclo-ligase [Sulfitobacter sp. BDSS02]MBR9848405.1 5-formyltetrahydrofolate cyclo-ligase [Paracoccaceae bacterium]